MKTLKIFKNILIVRTDRIGDVVLTTPAIKALHQAYPVACISILVTPGTFSLHAFAICHDIRQPGFHRLRKQKEIPEELIGCFLCNRHP